MQEPAGVPTIFDRLSRSSRAAAGVVLALAFIACALLAPPARSADSLQQTCEASILQMPKPNLLIMTGAGTWHQYIEATFSYSDVNDRCSQWQRLSQLRPQIEKAGHWLDVLPELPVEQDWTSIRWGRGNKAFETAGLGLIGNPPKRSKPPQPKHVFVRCVNGHWSGVRLVMRNLMRDKATGKTVAEKYKDWQVKVESSKVAHCP
jgi:hypothetical protein